MVIRDQQISAFNEPAEAAFEKQLAAYLREEHGSTIVRLEGPKELPLAALPNPMLEAMVKEGIKRARAYGMAWRSALAAFVVAMFVAAPNFDEDSYVHKLLRDEDIEPDYRMDTVSERLTEMQWDLIRQRYDAKAWGALDG